MTREKKEKLIRHLKYNMEIGADYLITDEDAVEIIRALEQESKTIQEKQAENEKYQKAFDDGYKNGYAQARFDYEQEQKIGHWIKYSFPRCGEQHYKCTSCGYYINFGQWGELYTKEFKYCPNCGCRMVEPQERQEREEV